MLIRRPTISELPQIRDFMLAIIKNDFGYDFNPQWHWDIENILSTYLKSSRSILLVAFENHDVVGTIAARPYDKNYPEFGEKYDKANTLGIWRHYIKKELRGLGIGKQLYLKVEEFAQKYQFQYLYLHTQKTISGSKEYWQKRGFQITLEKSDEWQTVHMEKKI
jgi:ribosomal protein S18 acetylase RimI-like enzyme